MRGATSCQRFCAMGKTTTATKDLLKFCKKVLDILTNSEHYVLTLAEKSPLFGPINVRHLVTPFEAWAIKHLVVRNSGRELLHGIR